MCDVGRCGVEWCWSVWKVSMGWKQECSSQALVSYCNLGLALKSKNWVYSTRKFFQNLRPMHNWAFWISLLVYFIITRYNPLLWKKKLLIISASKWIPAMFLLDHKLQGTKSWILLFENNIHRQIRQLQQSFQSQGL